MRYRIQTPKIMSLNTVVRKLGRVFMSLYTIALFVASSEVLSSSLTSITLYVFVLLGVADLLFNSNLSFRSRYVLWYVGFMGLSLFGVIVSEFFWPGNEWTDTFYQMFVMLMLGNAFSQFLKERKDIKLLAYSYMIGAVALVIILAAMGQLDQDERLGTTAMGNANTFAALYMVAIIFALWITLFSDKLWEKIVGWAAVVTIFYALLLSAGRKFILIPIVVLYIILLLRRDKKGRRHIILYTLVVVAIVLVVFYLIMENPVLYDIVGYRMEYLINMITGEGNVGSSNQIRQDLMTLAYEEGFGSPLIGHGFDSFKNLAGKELLFYAYSHNNWTEIWYNYGLLGMIVYYSLYLKLATYFWKNRNIKQEFSVFGLACVIAIFIFEYGGVTYYLYPVQILLCAVTSMWELLKKEKEVSYGET